MELYSYEVTFIINPEFDEEETQSVLKQIKGTIDNKGGKITDVDVWGKRKLAYEIDDYTTGFYVVIQFDAPGDTPMELERLLKLTDEVIRFIIVRTEEMNKSKKSRSA